MRRWLALSLILLTSCSSSRTAKPPASGRTPDLAPQFLCQRFVQNFYDWYVKLWNADGDMDNVTYIRGLNLRPHQFSSELSARLMENAAMHRRDPKLATLNGDPFLTAQYFDGPYRTAKITMIEDRCFADMYDADDPTGKTLVTAEVEAGGEDDWRFVDFYYPARKDAGGTDLMSVLKAAQGSREISAR